MSEDTEGAAFCLLDEEEVDSAGNGSDGDQDEGGKVYISGRGKCSRKENKKKC